MNTGYAIFKKMKVVLKMIISWFTKNECLDPDAMSFELQSIRLENHATALEVSLLVRNHGLSNLNINRLHAEFCLANYPLRTNPIPVSLTLDTEKKRAKSLKFLVHTPFLTNIKAIKDISNAIEHDLTLSDAPILVSVDRLIVDITRGVHSHTVEIDNICDSTLWGKKIIGLHYYHTQ